MLVLVVWSPARHFLAIRFFEYFWEAEKSRDGRHDISFLLVTGDTMGMSYVVTMACRCDPISRRYTYLE